VREHARIVPHGSRGGPGRVETAPEDAGKRLPCGIHICDVPVTLGSDRVVQHQGGQMNGTEMEVWTTPDFVEYETPMEVTAYAARMED
jgi:coenzyme PQQ precursor peptide PqqA